MHVWRMHGRRHPCNMQLRTAPARRTRVEYKYVIRGNGGTLCYWKPGGNFDLEVSAAPGAKIEVQEDWTGTVRRIEVVQQAVQQTSQQAASKAVATRSTRSLNPLDQQAQQSMEDLREAMSLHNKIMDRTRGDLLGEWPSQQAKGDLADEGDPPCRTILKTPISPSPPPSQIPPTSRSSRQTGSWRPQTPRR